MHTPFIRHRGILAVCLLIGLLAACEDQIPSGPSQAPQVRTPLPVVGWGYAKLPAQATPRQRLMARQRARRLAAASLAAQIAGSRFTYERQDKPSTTISQMSRTSQALIEQPQIEYQEVGNTGILVKQTAAVMLPQADIDRAFTYSTDMQANNVVTAEAALYRHAVEKAIQSQVPNLSRLSGTIYLTDFSIAAGAHQPGVTLKATLLVLFDRTAS